MSGYCTESFDIGKFEFFKSVWNFNKNNRKLYYDMLHNANDVKIIILKNNRQVKERMKANIKVYTRGNYDCEIKI